MIGPDTDRLEALWELATARGASTNHPDPEGWVPFALRRLGPAFRAADLGHTLEWDPPYGLTSITIRWTCTKCGDAVLAREYEPEAAYGAALTEPCHAAPAGPGQVSP